MDKINWIKDLVRAEQKMEESGVVDFSAGFDPANLLVSESHNFLNNLKAAFVEASSAFNNLKNSSMGRIKIYMINNTESDFMLFRNGFKLIFSLREPGLVTIRFHYVGASFVLMPPVSDNGQGVPSPEEDVLQARWGAFGDLVWTHQNQEVKTELLVRYYLSRFVRESAK